MSAEDWAIKLPALAAFLFVGWQAYEQRATRIQAEHRARREELVRQGFISSVPGDWSPGGALASGVLGYGRKHFEDQEIRLYLRMSFESGKARLRAQRELESKGAVVYKDLPMGTSPIPELLFCNIPFVYSPQAAEQQLEAILRLGKMHGGSVEDLSWWVQDIA